MANIFLNMKSKKSWEIPFPDWFVNNPKFNKKVPEFRNKIKTSSLNIKTEPSKFGIN